MNLMGLGSPWYPFIQHLPTQLQTWITWGTVSYSINVLMLTGAIKKRLPCNKLPQASGGRKYVCPVKIRTTDHLQ